MNNIHIHEKDSYSPFHTWWRHQMETFSALLALCQWNPPVTGEFPSQRPVTRSFDVFFDLHLKKRLNKHWATDSRRHRANFDVTVIQTYSPTQFNFVKVDQHTGVRLVVNLRYQKPQGQAVTKPVLFYFQTYMYKMF